MEEHWRWRMRMAKQIASGLDPEQYGVVAIYLLGSTKNATAREGSDIDLLVHFRGTEEQEKELRDWLGVWSRRLAEMNYRRTGRQSDGLLDVHLITDSDITRRTSYAVKIGASTDAAMPLPMKLPASEN
jgi:predicted nucleotidyltransferase